MSFDRRHKCAVSGEFDFYAAIGWQQMGRLETDEYLDLGSESVDLLLTTSDAKHKVSDATLYLHPTIGCSNGICIGVGPAITDEVIA
jgi:hypothetical protein